MRNQILTAATFILTCFWQIAGAQVSVHFNIGIQPIWGPVGYDYADYYYLPDIDAYYDINNQQYVYFDAGQWVTMGALPPKYRDFDLYRAHKVVINEPSPWFHNDRYRSQYITYRGRHDQVPIRDSHEERYWANPHHPEHGKWHGDKNRGHGHGEKHGHSK